jgi:hypothetical protein
MFRIFNDNWSIPELFDLGLVWWATSSSSSLSLHEQTISAFALLSIRARYDKEDIAMKKQPIFSHKNEHNRSEKI